MRSILPIAIFVVITVLVSLIAHRLIKWRLIASLIAALVSALLFQIIGYFVIGYFDPFAPIAFFFSSVAAFVISVLISFAFASGRK